MKIAIDATGAVGKRTGVGIYIYNLVEQLSKLDKDNDYLLYLNYFRPGKTNPFKNNLRAATNRIPARVQRFLQNNCRLPIEIFTGKIDLFHGPNYFIPPSKAKRIVTIHDLTFLRYPGTMVAGDAAYYGKYVPKSIEQADHVITISNSTKNGLVEKLGVPEEKITVTHLAAGKEFKPIEDRALIDKVLEKYNLEPEFMLTVCTLEPRKNLITLIKTLDILKKRGKLNQKLVVVGGSGWKNEALFSEINRLNLQEDIILPGYINQADLPYLYNACSVFLFPSFYEGFGIPPLEALSCSAPSICSNTSSIPEVVGDAAILIEPKNAELWAEKIANLLDNPSLQKELKQKGPLQAGKFSWEKTAKETLEVYKKLKE